MVVEIDGGGDCGGRGGDVCVCVCLCVALSRCVFEGARRETVADDEKYEQKRKLQENESINSRETIGEK